jgi:hypothetical protein
LGQTAGIIKLLRYLDKPYIVIHGGLTNFILLLIVHFFVHPKIDAYFFACPNLPAGRQENRRKKGHPIEIFSECLISLRLRQKPHLIHRFSSVITILKVYLGGYRATCQPSLNKTTLRKNFMGGILINIISARSIWENPQRGNNSENRE